MLRLSRGGRGLRALAVVALLAVPRFAHAEAHPTSQDVRVTVEPSGAATVAQRLGYRVATGALKSVDVVGIEAGAIVEPVVAVIGEEGTVATAHAAPAGERTLRVTLDDPHGLRRGSYVFTLRYRLDLVAQKLVAADGPLWRLSWRSPVATEGLDGVRVVFQLPPGPSEPRAVQADSDAVDDGVVVSLRRTPDHDEMELLRPHVARGEAVPWTLRVDPRAFPEVREPSLRPPPPPPPVKGDEGRDQRLVLAVLVALAALYGLLVHAKERAVARACLAAGPDVRPRPVIAASPILRAVASAVAAAAGVILQLTGGAVAGGGCLAVAMAFAAFRAPSAPQRARGPGRWLALRPEDAFFPRAPEGAWLDAGTLQGRGAFVGLAALIAVVATLAARLDAHVPFFLALDILAFVPLFATGRAVQLPPDVARSAPVLRSIHRRLRRRDALRTTPWARVPTGEVEPDELRLLVAPRAPAAGLVAIEIGVAWGPSPVGYAPVPEVLVRVAEGSAAAERLHRLVPESRSLPGRRPEERVHALSPRWPTAASAAELATWIAQAVADDADDARARRDGAASVRPLVKRPRLADTRGHVSP